MPDEKSQRPDRSETLRLTTEIVSAYVRRNMVPSSEVPQVLSAVFDSLSSLNGGAAATAAEAPTPAVSIKRSVTPDYIVCLEDGKKLKMLKRHLRAAYGLSPDQYRTKWGLPADYPMVAPNYTAKRSAFAKSIGLGRKPGEKRSRKGRKTA